MSFGLQVAYLSHLSGFAQFGSQFTTLVVIRPNAETEFLKADFISRRTSTAQTLQVSNTDSY
jgi:hypothetical protein